MDTATVRVLLVDDDEQEYVLVQKYLKRARMGDFSVEWAPSIAQAMDALKKAAHDICLLDYRLGEGTGVERASCRLPSNHPGRQPANRALPE